MKKFLRIALLIGGSLLLGIGLGVMLVLTDTDASPIAIFAALFLSIWLATVLHEGGHLVAGLLTGYRFCSFRIGSLMLYRGEHGLRFGRFSLPGTGGQCLLEPPAYTDDMPVVFYNLGGSFMNLLTGALAVVLAVLTNAFLLWVFAFVSIAFALLNGIPINTEMVPNDGKNAITLHRDADARRALWVQLAVNAAQTRGKRLKDMPIEWFTLPESFTDTGALTCSVGYFALARALDAMDFDRAKSIGEQLLGEAKALPGVHRLMTEQELYLLSLLAGDATAPEARLKAFYQQTKKLPSTQRMLYAIARLVDRDEKAAATALDAFLRIAKRYPFTGEIESERELIAKIDARVEF